MNLIVLYLQPVLNPKSYDGMNLINRVATLLLDQSYLTLVDTRYHLVPHGITLYYILCTIPNVTS